MLQPTHLLLPAASMWQLHLILLLFFLVGESICIVVWISRSKVMTLSCQRFIIYCCQPKRVCRPKQKPTNAPTPPTCAVLLLHLLFPLLTTLFFLPVALWVAAELVLCAPLLDSCCSCQLLMERHCLHSISPSSLSLPSPALSLFGSGSNGALILLSKISIQYKKFCQQ